MWFTTITVLLALLHFQRKIVQKLLHLMNVVEQKAQKKLLGISFFITLNFICQNWTLMFYRPSLHSSLLLERNITCKAYNIYCTLKFLRIKRNPATAILRASTCLQKKIKNTVTSRDNLQLNGCAWLEHHFSMQRKKTLIKHNTGIQVVNAKYITLHQSTKQYSGCPCRSHYQLLTEN